MVRHLRTISLFGMALMVAFSVMLPQATTAREVANTTPDDATITDYFWGYLSGGETRCYDLPTDKLSYAIFVQSGGIVDFYLLKNDSSSPVKTTRVENTIKYLFYFPTGFVTRLQICAFNLSFDTTSYSINP